MRRLAVHTCAALTVKALVQTIPGHQTCDVYEKASSQLGWGPGKMQLRTRCLSGQRLELTMSPSPSVTRRALSS